jgi:hypothetical protein
MYTFNPLTETKDMLTELDTLNSLIKTHDDQSSGRLGLEQFLRSRGFVTTKNSSGTLQITYEKGNYSIHINGLGLGWTIYASNKTIASGTGESDLMTAVKNLP